MLVAAVADPKRCSSSTWYFRQRLPTSVIFSFSSWIIRYPLLQV